MRLSHKTGNFKLFPGDTKQSKFITNMVEENN